MLSASPKLKNIPQKSGIYFFRDRNRKVLYLGKAANLKNRLKSYYDKSSKNPRLQKMLEAARSIDWQETGSEIEALLLESRLIKKYRPPFNVMLRDDKQYFYIELTKEELPKLIITHQPLNAKRYTLNANLIGPFTDGTALKTALKLLRRIFPYCACKQKHNNFCLNYHIGNCPGFCCLKQQNPKSKGKSQKAKLEYRKNIKAIKSILSGEKTSLIKKFEKEMNTLAREEKFEKAIELRDKIEKLKRVFENARIVDEMGQKETERFGALAELKKTLSLPALPQRIEGYDVSNIHGEFATGAMVVFTRSASSGQADFQPDKNKYRKFKIRAAGGDTGMIQEILTRRLNHPEWPYPDLIIIDGGKGQLNAAKAAISKSKIQMTNKILIIALTKNIKHKGSHMYTSPVRSSPPKGFFGPRLRAGATSNGVSNKKAAVPLKKIPSAVRNLILRIDAEAHRFAIGYYRKLHRRNF
jgi:excinuclease ABC subunit C